MDYKETKFVKASRFFYSDLKFCLIDTGAEICPILLIKYVKGRDTGNWNDRVLLLAEMGFACSKSARTLASFELTWTM